MKPYCFLDWDGVGNTVHANPETGHDYEAMGYKIRVPKTFPANVERLIEKFDMVWLTTWEHHANEHHCKLFGWGEWPVIEWRSGGHHDHAEYKLDGLVEYLDLNGHRPFVFIDDQVNYEIGEKRQRDWFLHEHVTVPYLLLAPEHYVGLTTEETDAALKFAEENVQ